MKKLISLVLVLCLILALAPAAFAAGEKEEEKAPTWEELKKETGEGFLKDYAKYFFDGDSRLLGSGGHLATCDGKNCCCVSVLKSAEEEYRQQKFEEELEVWIRSTRDADDVRHEVVVAEIRPAYSAKKITMNEDYLEANAKAAEQLEEFYGDDNIAKKLYRPTDFINAQTEGSLAWLEDEKDGLRDVEYLLMDVSLSGSIDVYDSSKGDDGDKLIFSRAALDEELLAYGAAVNAGGVLVQLPEDYGNKAFSLGLSYNDNGSLSVMLLDDAGKPIPGALVMAPVAADAELCTVEGDKLSAVKDCVVEGGYAAFALPTGNDVFALNK